MTKTHTSRIPLIIVHNAPKEKQALLNEFEHTQAHTATSEP